MENQASNIIERFRNGKNININDFKKLNNNKDIDDSWWPIMVALLLAFSNNKESDENVQRDV